MLSSKLLRLGMLTALGTMSLVLILVAVFALALLLPGSNQHAAEAGGMWFGWLYEPQSEVFIRIYEDGSTEEHTLALPPGLRLASSPNAFAPNGELLALCVYNESSNTSSLYIHSFNPDAAAKAGLSFPVVYDLGQRTECSVPSNAFNTTDPNQLAIGVVNHFPGDANADATRPMWELLIFDIAQNAITARYDATSPGTADLQPMEGDRWVWMPVVHRFEGDQVYFELAPWGTEFLPGQKVVAWQVGTQTVTPISGPLGQVGLKRNTATGEMVWMAVDESLPAAQPMGPMPAYNVVLYQHPSMSEPYAIYHDPAVIPTQLVFVKGGELLAIQVSPGFDPNAAPDMIQPPSWLLLDRSGTITPLYLGQYAYTIAGLRDGFAAWESDFENWTATLTRYSWDGSPADATTSVLWTGDNPNWSLVWSVPQPTGDSGMQFQPIAQ